MTQPTNIVRLGDRLDAPAPADEGPLRADQLATPIVGPADRFAGPDAGAIEYDDGARHTRFTSPWRGEVDCASAQSGGVGSLAANSVPVASPHPDRLRIAKAVDPPSLSTSDVSNVDTSEPCRTREHASSAWEGDAERAADVTCDRPRPDAGVDLTNVIAFTPLRRDGPANDLAQEQILAKLVLGDADRLTTVVGNNDTRPWIVGLLLCSGLVHAGILAALNREPQPMASIGIEVVSVELVFGANSAAGPAAPTDDQSTAQAPAPPEPAAATQETAVQPQQDKPEPTPETMTANPVPPPPQTNTEPEPVTARQEAAVPPPEPAPVQVAPEPTPIAVAPPPPAKKPVEQAPPPRSTKPARPAPADQKHPAARQPRTDGRLAAREPATAPGGIGPGRSDSVSTYRGIVYAQLSRQKHAPAGVLRAGERRTGTVSFTIDGNGRANRIALVRSTGVASLDEEAQAMVRRASPFPPPPGGRPMPITAPVAFSVR